MRLQEATTVASEVRAWLAPACDRIEVAGSVRRGKADVRDLEIVAIPRRAGRPVFGQPPLAPLDALLADLVRQWHLRWDRETPRNGPKHKRLVHDSTHQRIDLFLTTPENWGNILAIRTGDADFSRLLVTKRTEGGLMPYGYCQRDGALWEVVLKVAGPTVQFDRRIPCPEEADFFGELGIWSVPAPEARTGDLARQLARELVAK